MSTLREAREDAMSHCVSPITARAGQNQNIIENTLSIFSYMQHQCPLSIYGLLRYLTIREYIAYAYFSLTWWNFVEPWVENTIIRKYNAHNWLINCVVYTFLCLRYCFTLFVSCPFSLNMYLARPWYLLNSMSLIGVCPSNTFMPSHFQGTNILCVTITSYDKLLITTSNHWPLSESGCRTY